MRPFRPTDSKVIFWLGLLLVILAFAPLAQAEPIAIAQSVHLNVSGDVTQFELELDRDIEFSVFALADPYRVIIDLPEIDFQIPQVAGPLDNVMILAYRFGLFSAGKSRIVIDTVGPVAIADPVIHRPAGERPARLVVELSPISRELFLRDFALNGTSQLAALAPKAARTVTPSPEPRKVNAKPVIVIDPGHGGIDPGAISKSGVQEKYVVLEFAKHLASRLRSSGAFKVELTRDSDVFVRLDRRRNIAHQYQADLFLSIHADSITTSGVRGATVYTVSDKASDELAAALAAKENRADIIAGVQLEDVSDEVSDILIELARRDTRNRSLDFANFLVSEMSSKIKLNSNPHRSASFVVLKSADVPSVLIELGYLSNRKDTDALRSKSWQTKASSSIISAMERYFGPRVAKNN